jgi:hypothetical protein
LISAAAVAEYARRADHDPVIDERIRNLTAPQLGHWREYLRLLPPWLAGRGDDGYRRLWSALDTPRTDLPRPGLSVTEQRRLAEVLLAGAAEFVECIDGLAGRRLVYIERVEKHGDRWVIDRFDLSGDFMRLPILESSADRPEQLPDADRLYLATVEADSE